MAMYGYVGLCMAMWGCVKLCHILTNGEPLYDAYTTYLPKKVLRLLALLAALRPKMPAPHTDSAVCTMFILINSW